MILTSSVVVFPVRVFLIPWAVLFLPIIPQKVILSRHHVTHSHPTAPPATKITNRKKQIKNLTFIIDMNTHPAKVI